MAVRHLKLEFETKGLVHIGSGKKYGKKDYFESGGKVAVLDVARFIAALNPQQLDEYCTFLRDDPERNGGLQKFLESSGLMRFAQKCIAYRVDVRLPRARGGTIQYVDEFVKGPDGNPYIPGSSVKGAIRTAILTCMALDNAELRKRGERALRDSRGEKSSDAAFIRAALGTEQPEGADSTTYNLMRYISVADSDPLSTDDLVFAKKYDLFSKKDDGSHKRRMGHTSIGEYNEGNELNINRECLRPGTKFSIDIDIDDRIDRYLPAALDAEGLMKMLERSFERYSECFLSQYDAETDAAGKGAAKDDGRCQYIYESGPLKGMRCRNRAVNGTHFCNMHKDKAAAVQKAAEATLYLGGGVDFDSKTIINAIFLDDQERVGELAHLLFDQFPTKADRKLHDQLIKEVQRAGFEPQPMRAQYKYDGSLNKGKEDHRHWQDPVFGVSPHTMKFGIVERQKYPMGKCAVSVRER